MNSARSRDYRPAVSKALLGAGIIAILVAIVFGGFTAFVAVFYGICSLAGSFLFSRRGQQWLRAQHHSRALESRAGTIRKGHPQRTRENGQQRPGTVTAVCRTRQRRETPDDREGRHGPGCSCGIGGNALGSGPVRKQLPR